MEFSLKYMHQEEGQKDLTIQSGNILFMVGPNGTGKSTLMHTFTTQNAGKVLRITAHRQVWFNSDSVDLTPTSRIQTEQQITNVDRHEQSRWKDDYAHQRSQATLFDLIDSDNTDARKIAAAARASNFQLVAALAAIQAPLAKMNDILRISNLHFQVSVDAGSKLTAARDGFAPYSVAELSDGERNSLLIIANVLTAKENTLILLDEPERHLHRSIVSPLISTLLSYRPDCAFVISTHDISLPYDQEKCSALLLRKYYHQPKSWTADFVPAVEDMDEEVALAVLGSRRTLLFVEGKASSLDLQLYQILYPDVSIKALGSCADVERVVKGITQSHGNHWIRAFGIIDRDDRSLEECESLYAEGIFPLDQYSVESLYYHPEILKAILNRVATVNAIEPVATYESIVTSAIKATEFHKDRLAARLVQRKAKDLLSRQAPDWRGILKRNVKIEFTSDSSLDEELQLIEEMIAARDSGRLISRYPLRETQVLEIISKGALFPSMEKYEQAVRKMLIEENTVRDALKQILSPISERMLRA